MADDILDPLMMPEPFDLGSIVQPQQAAPQSAPQPPQKKKGGIAANAVLAAIMPLIAKKYGPAGMAGLMRGYQRAEMQSEQQSQQDYQNQRLMAGDQRAIDQQQANEAYRQQALQQRQREQAAAIVKDFSTKLAAAETPEELASLSQAFRYAAQVVGIRSDAVEGLISKAAPTPAGVMEKQVRKVVGGLTPEQVDQYLQGGLSITVPGQDLPVPVEVWSKYVTTGVDKDGKRIVAVKKPPAPANRQLKDVWVNGERRFANYDPDTGKMYDPDTGQEVTGAVPIAPQAPQNPGDKPLTSNQRANIIASRRNQWQRFTKAVLDRQGATAKIDTGIDALKRGNRNAATQIIITAFNKLQDEGSVVREGEYARSEQLVPILNRIEGALQKFQLGGAAMKDSDLLALANEAKAVSAALQAVSDGAAADLRQGIQEELDDYGIPPSRVFGGSTIGARSARPTPQSGPSPKPSAADTAREKLRGR